jgi:stage III sporulation protein AC
MDVGLLFQIAGIGMLVSVVVIILKQSHKEEWGQIVTIAGAALALGIVLKLVYELFRTVQTLFRF